MLGVIAVSLVFQKAIALPAHAMRLDALLKELSTSSGELYKAGAPMAGRIVFVGGPARGAADLRADLAAATWGKWRRVGDEWLLDEDREALRARDARRTARMVAAIRMAQAKWLSRPYRAFDAAAARGLRDRLARVDAEPDEAKRGRLFEAARDDFPTRAALERVVANLDAEALAALGHGEEAVFSDRPNRLQRPLSRAGIDAVRRLERDQSTWASVAPGLDADQWWMDDPRLFDDRAAPGSLRLVLRVSRDDGEVRYEGWFVDARRTIRARGSGGMPLLDAARTIEPPPATSKEPPLAISEESLAHAAALTGSLNPALRPTLLRPDLREPLDFFVGDACRGFPKAFVAWLPDAALMLGYAPEALTPKELLFRLRLVGLETVEIGGTLVGRPLQAEHNVDRAALAALLGAADRVGFLPLDETADYCAGPMPPAPAYAPSWQLDEFAMRHLDAILPGASGLVGDVRALRLWGLLSNGERAGIRKNGTLAFRAMLPAVRDRFVAEIIAGEKADLQVQGRGEGSTLDDEPTEILAEASALSGVLTGGLLTEMSVMVQDRSGEVGYGPPERLGHALAERARNPSAPGGYPDSFPNDLLPGVRAGRSLTLRMAIRLSPKVVWRRETRHGEFDLRQALRPVGELPQGIRREVEAGLRKPPGG